VTLLSSNNSLGNEMNNNDLDGNIVFLNEYQLNEDERFLAAEIAQDDLDMRIEELVVSEIESDSATAIEAIGTEATLFGVNEINSEFKQILLEAIQCKGSNAQDLADKDLGKIVRELVTAYIAHDVEDLV
jgi:hypothetical protein